MTLVSALLAETNHEVALIAPPWVFGVIGLVLFTIAAFITWSYRDVANRHSHKAAPDAAEHAGGPGTHSHGSGH